MFNKIKSFIHEAVEAVSSLFKYSFDISLLYHVIVCEGISLLKLERFRIHSTFSESWNFQLAPDVPPQETFVFHWKAITNYFIEATGEYIQALLLCWMFTLLLTCFCLVYTQWFADEKVPVQSTNIPYHLEQMRNILRHEEDDQTGGTAVKVP